MAKSKASIPEHLKKSAPQPSSVSEDLTKFFELKLFESSITAFNDEDYLKSALLSWGCVEECFLQQLIKFVALHQKVNLDKNILNANASQLIRYYYMLSYDTELYELLEEARKLRNDVVHNIYKSKSLNTINQKAKKSASYNIKQLVRPMVSRLNGITPIPSLTLYASGWNDSVEKFNLRIQHVIDELGK